MSFRAIIQSYGAGVITAVVTAVSVLISLSIASGLDLLFKGYVPLVDLLIAGLIPAILAPFATYGFIRLSQQLDRTEAQLRTLVAEDVLTKAFTRRHFFKLTEMELSRAEREEGLVSLLMVDADHFKRINDTHGHLVGDEALKLIVRVCREHIRESDLLGRYGGEEFAILLPDTGPFGALEVAERIRAAMSRATLPLDGGGTVQLTVSIGVATTARQDPQLDDLLRRADSALYEAKEERNTVCCCPQSQQLEPLSAMALNAGASEPRAR